jgi:hypothetical protein
MKTITEQSAILALLPDFSQTILEDGGNGETIEHGHLNLGDDNECKARVIYALPADGKYDQDSGEFLGDWNAHIVRMEIDQEIDQEDAA